MSNSYHTLLVLAIALVLAFAAPLKAQDQPQDYLNAHNRARTDVGVGPLVWNETVADYAQAYARRRSDCRLILSGGPYGENLAWSSIGFTASQAVSLWVNEKSNYVNATNTCLVGTKCHLYTQVVWRNTVSLGCAKVSCDSGGGTFTICNYDPAGNVIGERPF